MTDGLSISARELRCSLWKTPHARPRVLLAARMKIVAGVEGPAQKKV
jgi:hypothetical protein